MNEFIIRLLGNRSGSYFRNDSGIKIPISREIINEYTSEIINIYIYMMIRFKDLKRLAKIRGKNLKGYYSSHFNRLLE